MCEFRGAGPVALVNRVQALEHMFGTFSPEVDTLGVVHVSTTSARPSHGATFATLRENARRHRGHRPVRRFFDQPVDHTVDAHAADRKLPRRLERCSSGINASVDWNDGMPMMNWVATGKDLTWVLRDRQTR